MANRDGVITKKDVFEQEAIDAPLKYIENVQKAVASVNELTEVAKKLNGVLINFKNSPSEAEYISLKKEANFETRKAILEIKQLEIAERKAAEAKKKVTEVTLEEKIQQQQLNKTLREEAMERLGLVGAYQRLNKSRAEAKNRLRDLQAAQNSSTSEIKKAQREYDILDNKVRKIDHSVGDFTKSVGNYGARFASLGRSLISAFGIMEGVQLLASAAKGAFNTVQEFNQSIADLKAITGTAGKDLEYLKNSAKDLGKETVGGAVKVVEAYKLIASAKPELLENVKNLNEVTESVLILSKAAGLDLPEAATSLTDAMNQFNAPAKDAGMFIDALANGAKYGAAEIPQITEALLKFGAVSKSSNISIQESTALIELLAEKGLKGAEAGTALKNVLLKISSPNALPREALSYFEKYGISLQKLNDSSIPIQEKLETLKPLLSDNAALVKIFGYENVVAARNLLSSTDRLKELIPKMKEFGTAQEQAEIRTNTLKGSVNELSSTYDSFILLLEDGEGAISNTFKFFIDKAKEALNILIRINSTWSEIFLKAKETGTEDGKRIFAERLNFLQGTGDEKEITKSIKTVAEKNYKIQEAALKEVDNKIKQNAKDIKSGKSLIENVFRFDERGLKKEREEIIRKLALEAEIIRQAGERINRGKVKETDTQTQTPLTEAQKSEQDKAEKDRLARLKRISDAEFELEKQRLEQIIKINDEIASNEELNDNERLKALKTRLDTEGQLAELEKNNKLNQDNFVLAEDRLLENEKLLIINEATNKKIDNEKKAKEELDKITAFDEEYFKTELAKKTTALNEAEAQELAAAKEKYKKLSRLQRQNPENIEGYEAKKLAIKNKYAIKEIQAQMATAEETLALSDAYELLGLEGMALSSKKKEEILKQLSDLRLKLLAIEEKEAEDKEKKALEREKRKWAKIKEWAKEAFDITKGFIDQGFENRIAKIDEEIQANDEYYQRQIEAAGNDQRTKDILQAESEKKRKALEEEKKKEQKKQFEINKYIAAAEIAMNTAAAIMAIARTGNGTFYTDFGISAGVAIGVTAALGAAQAALVLSQKPPAYKEGRKGGIPEWAFVGDGGVNEVLEKQDGTIRLSPNVPTLTYLERGENVYKSVDDYLKNSNKLNFDSVYEKEKEYNLIKNNISFEDKYQKENNEILKRILAENMKKKSTIINNKIDLGHEIWKRNQNSFL